MDVLILNRTEVEHCSTSARCWPACATASTALADDGVNAPHRNELTVPRTGSCSGCPGDYRRPDDGEGRDRVRANHAADAPGHDRPLRRPPPAPAGPSWTAPTSPRSAPAPPRRSPPTCSRARTPARWRSSARACRASIISRRSRSCASSTRSGSARSISDDAHRLATLHPRAHAVDDPEAAVRGADVVALATHAAQPVIAQRVDRPRHARQLRRLPPARRGASARPARPSLRSSWRPWRRSSRRRSAVPSSRPHATPP